MANARAVAPPPVAPVIDHIAFPMGLGVVAGFIDIYGFLAWHGMLAAHVTGNLIFAAVEIAHGRYELVMKLAALPIFAACVAASAWTIETWRSRGRHPLRLALMLEALIIALCILPELLLPAPQGPDDSAAVVGGTTALCAMALQNTIMRLILNNMPPTTVMTGNITFVMCELVRRTREFSAAALSHRVRLIATSLSGFVAGAILGGMAQTHAGPWALLVPVAALLALLPVERAAMRAAAAAQGTG